MCSNTLRMFLDAPSRKKLCQGIRWVEGIIFFGRLGIKCFGSGTHLWHMFPCFVSAACDIFCHILPLLRCQRPSEFQSCQRWADMFLAKHVQSRVHLASKASHGKCLENSKVHWFLYLMMLEADCFDGKRVSNGSDRNQNHLWFAIQFA